MERVKDYGRLSDYISKYKINEIFTVDMIPHMELLVFHRNEYICKTDEKLQYLFFFVEGKAKVYASLSNGKSLLLCFYKPFMIIGDVEFIHFDTANSNIQVIDETYCIGIPLEKVRTFALEDSKFLKYMCSSLGDKLVKLGKYSSINLLYPLENRLASYILATTSPDATAHRSEEGIIIFDGNLAEISEILGTSYRHLLRTLNELNRQGAIKKNASCYEVLNIDILQKLAGDLYD